MIAPEGRIATFYSYKGGTGRSMALANFAWILAASGKRVLTIDWDLEAPGLHRFFRPFLTDPDLFETNGLIDTFWDFAASAMANLPSSNDPSGSQIAGTLDDSKRRLNQKFATGGYIDFVGAGRQGATYSERVNTFDWKRFYELGGARMLTTAQAHLRSLYDWVLIDSRTGVSDTAGICTIQLPDTVVACFTMNRQSIDGVDAIMRSIRAFRSASIDGSKITFFPLATRIENAESVRLESARTYARRKLRDILPATNLSVDSDYWDDMEIAYRPWYAFEEVLAAFGDATGATRAKDTMLSQMEAMARCIAGNNTLRVPEVLTVDRTEVLSKYAFGSLTIPGEKAAPPAGMPATVTTEHDAGDTEFLRGLIAKEQVWRRRNFSWRYLLSRRELDLLTDDDRKQFGRNMAYYISNSERAQRHIRTLSIAFVLNCVLVLIICYFFFVPAVRLIEPVNSAVIGISILLTIPVALWAIFGILGGSLVNLLGNPPYGFQVSDSISRVLTGQLGGRIRDYDPEDTPSFMRYSSPTKD
jgi:cellulose biosynthesis protein BcsQ